MSDLLHETKRQAAKAPARRWHNKWMSIGESGYCEDCGRLFVVNGEIYFDCCGAPFPSQDVAESRAREDISFQMADCGYSDVWLGAFPVDE